MDQQAAFFDPVTKKCIGSLSSNEKCNEDISPRIRTKERAKELFNRLSHHSRDSTIFNEGILGELQDLAFSYTCPKIHKKKSSSFADYWLAIFLLDHMGLDRKIQNWTCLAKQPDCIPLECVESRDNDQKIYSLLCRIVIGRLEKEISELIKHLLCGHHPYDIERDCQTKLFENCQNFRKSRDFCDIDQTSISDLDPFKPALTPESMSSSHRTKRPKSNRRGSASSNRQVQKFTNSRNADRDLSTFNSSQPYGNSSELYTPKSLSRSLGSSSQSSASPSTQSSFSRSAEMLDPATPCPRPRRARSELAQRNNTGRSSSEKAKLEKTDMENDDNSLSLPEFEPYKGETVTFKHILQNVIDRIRNPKFSPKESPTHDSSYIYILELTGRDGYVKIGRTTQRLDNRIQQVSSCFRFELQMVQAYRTPFHIFAESLIFNRLGNERHRFKCLCNKKRHIDGTPKHIEHGEWFKVDKAMAKETVRTFTEWIKLFPYEDIPQNRVWSLKSKWQSKITALEEKLDKIECPGSSEPTKAQEKLWAELFTLSWYDVFLHNSQVFFHGQRKPSCTRAEWLLDNLLKIVVAVVFDVLFIQIVFLGWILSVWKIVVAVLCLASSIIYIA